MFPNGCAAGEVEGRRLRIGSLLIVIVKEFAAATRDPRRRVQAPHEADDIEAVNAVVSEFAGAQVPPPVPVVMKAVRMKRRLRARPEPEAVIDSRRNYTRLQFADALPAARDPGSREW